MPAEPTAPSRHRGETKWSPTAFLVGILLFGVAGALALTVGLGRADDQTTATDPPAGTTLPAPETSGPPTSTASDSPAGSPTGSTTPTTEDSPTGSASSSASTATDPGKSKKNSPAAPNRKKPSPKPMPVISGKVLVHKTPEQIAEEERIAAQIEAAKKPFTITVGSFNVLGSQHTTPRGDHPNYPSARTRNGWAAGMMRAHGVDVLGMQELQTDQLNAITSMTGMAAFPGYQFGANETDNSILYDTSIFEFVSGSSFTIHFMHANRPQTILKLRYKPTGREMYFLNMHASAGEGQYAVTRRAGHYTAVATINRLKAEGLPIFLMGDMNDRAEFFCRVAPPTGMHSADGSNINGGCHPAGRLAVDWVLGTSEVQFSDYWQDRTAVTRKVSDHFFISSKATLGPIT